MMRLAIIIPATAISAYAVYAAAVASYGVARDPTLVRITRLSRHLLAWIVPFVGPGVVLRSTADVAPQSLPGRYWLLPLFPLYYGRPQLPNALADRDDLKTFLTPGTNYDAHR